VSRSIEEVYKPGACYIDVRLDPDTLSALQIEISAHSVRKAILAAPKLKLKENVCARLEKTRLSPRSPSVPLTSPRGRAFHRRPRRTSS